MPVRAEDNKIQQTKRRKRGEYMVDLGYPHLVSPLRPLSLFSLGSSYVLVHAFLRDAIGVGRKLCTRGVLLLSCLDI